MKKRPSNLEELCGKPKGSFQDFLKRKNAFLDRIERERKQRISEKRKGK